ncbi:hypothetical protein D3C78_1664530 [compost metagenome]
MQERAAVVQGHHLGRIVQVGGGLWVMANMCGKRDQADIRSMPPGAHRKAQGGGKRVCAQLCAHQPE